MTNEQLIVENIKAKLKQAHKRMSVLEAWAKVERKEDPEQYQISMLEFEKLWGYTSALRELLQFPPLKISKPKTAARN